MYKKTPLTPWQEQLPDGLPWHIKRSIELGRDGCWLWLRSLSRDGYGWTSLKDKTYQAHRLVFALLRGGVDPNLVIDHLCRVRHCVNPDHMEQVTPRENIERSELTPAGRKECLLGHGPLSPYAKQRRCLVCLAEYNRSRRETRRKAKTAQIR